MKQEMVTYEPRPYELTEKQVNIVANTEFVPQQKRGKLDVIWASIFRGRSLGIDDMTAINEIHVVNGKPAESAALAAGLVRKRGHKIDIERGPGSVTAIGTRADNGSTDSVTWTLDMAKDAGLAGKQVWKQYPQSMLRARAITELCRSLFSDCFLGGVYTPEELGADFTPEDDVIESTAEEIHEGSASEREKTTAMEHSDSGAVSSAPRSLAEFNKLKRDAGISISAVQAKSAELYGTRSPQELTPDEIQDLWTELQHETAAA